MANDNDLDEYAQDSVEIARELGEELRRGEDVFHAIVDRAEVEDAEIETIGEALQLTYAPSEIALADGDQVVYQAETYTVREVMDDGYGMAMCLLEIEANG